MRQINKSLILLVDDIPDNIQLLGKLLNSRYRTSFAKDGEQALTLVKKIRPDLILLDILMPEMNGFEVCRRLKACSETKDIPVIFLTALTNHEDITEGFRVGGVDYVKKPFQVEELLARVETHISLQNAKKALQEAIITRDRFFAIIAHDLRGPFGGFRELTELFIRQINFLDKNDLKNNLENFRQSVKTLYELLENLLSWSQLQQGLMIYLPQRIDLNKTIQDVMILFNQLAALKQIKLVNHIQNDFWVFADSNMLNSVIRNLISNAIKYTQPNGTIEASAQRLNEIVEITIKDTGIGMSKEMLSKLFQIQTNRETVRKDSYGNKGSGLGLILCHDFVKTNHGNMCVESETDKGTIFRFTLPSGD
jgi:signal transduction histidine kinase